jgi:hypothetical protein
MFIDPQCGYQGQDCGDHHYYPPPPPLPTGSNGNGGVVNGSGGNSGSGNSNVNVGVGKTNNDPCAGLDPDGVIYGICQVDKSAPTIPPCSLGWVSALTTFDGSCGHAEINGTALVDVIEWDHIVAPIGGGVFLIASGVVFIQLGIGLCTSVVGCAAAIPGLILPGIAAIPAGLYFIYTGINFGRQYLDDVFIIKP